MNAGLGIGSLAPSINALDWLRGDPLSSFQLGKMYILGFFKTTCDSCGSALSCLGRLQDRYSDIGVEVIGVAANESGATAGEARARVDAWVAERLPNTTIRIGFDYSGEMEKHWNEASRTFHVPTAFVVARDNSIAFIGCAHALPDVFPRVLDGTWGASLEAKADEKERIAEWEAHFPLRALFDRIKAATAIEAWKAALLAIDEGIGLFPENIMFHQWKVSILLEGMREMDASWVALCRFIRDAIERSDVRWLLAAMDTLVCSAYDYSSPPMAEAISMGKELCSQILRLCPEQDALTRARSYEMIAYYYHESGDNYRAVDLIEQALKLVDEESLPDVEKQKRLVQLGRILTEYKGEQ
ncbi:Thiol-disulfide isomerase-like thioredoxin [Neorhizobium galegae bv. officinalis]|uniref:Thiol-disulfide isomerase-like thioredoxin n=1 Tax=Neorhizobium galegae bv. officinalis TaxID=323656 RepID=A0A0T7G1F1_NEOGA|nr:redoxin domain-containing protein [Neorhizobium galegae]CDZ41086.1 Thiol-disulfide isomerase-like thioredoxin [Neorhizobium galegae bv. officinalis]CDZ53466.1 Thiol-disulfide isomerase-like thioredoxin [Neorhizobium galegae bv. officinalis]